MIWIYGNISDLMYTNGGIVQSCISHLLLSPGWSLHRVRLPSEQRHLHTTLEAPPTGMSPPNLRVLGASVVDVNWATPAQPNGIILQYELYRRAYTACDEE